MASEEFVRSFNNRSTWRVYNDVLKPLDPRALGWDTIHNYKLHATLREYTRAVADAAPNTPFAQYFRRYARHVVWHELAERMIDTHDLPYDVSEPNQWVHL